MPKGTDSYASGFRPVYFFRSLPAIGIMILLLASMCTPPVTPYSLAKFEPPGNYAYSGVGTRAGEFQEYVNAAGKIPALRMTFYDWGDAFPNNPSDELSVRAILNAGMIPVLTWEPFDVDLTAIAGGSEDAYIDAWANAAKAEGKPIFLRFAHEMNTNWYPWQNNTTGQTQTPAQYVAAYRHIYDRFRLAGATNVAFVWCPNWESRGPGWDSYYPGDEYVDWAGVDLYNWPRWPRTFEQMVDTFYNEFAGRKPIMVCEVASAEEFTPDPGYENPSAQNKAQWITDMFNAMNTKYPRIKGYVWFNLLKETDWRVQSSPASAAAYRAAVANARYWGKNDIGPIISPSPSPSPQPGYNVSTTHRWANYNNSNKPIEQFSVRPGTTVTQSVYYKNTGTRADSYNVTVSGIPSGWWRFTIYGQATLQPNEGRYGNVFITPATAGTYDFTVKVTSNGNTSVSSTQTYRLYVGTGPSPTPSPSPQPGYNVSTTHRWANYNNSNKPIEQFSVRPGTTVTQSVYYKNTGTRADSYNVTVSGIPSSWWRFTLYGAATLQPNEGRYGNVFITPASTGDYTFTVRTASRGNPAVYSDQTYTLHVR